MNRKRFDLIEQYKTLNRPLILDGAVGSLLYQRNVSPHKELWSSFANLTNPNEVLKLHKEYIDSGAEIITANTFRTNPVAFKKTTVECSLEEFVQKSVQIAIDAREDKEIIIAGSNAPAEDCYQTERTILKHELEYNHKKHIELLWESGCDIIWNETQSHWDEIEIICRFCSQNTLPFLVNLYFTDALNLLSGEPLNEAVRFIKDFSPVAIGFNCIKADLFERFRKNYSLPKYFGFYFNCGAGSVSDEIISCGVDPQSYVTTIESLLKMKPLFVGSCCGSNPNHTKAIKEKFDEVYRN